MSFRGSLLIADQHVIVHAILPQILLGTPHDIVPREIHLKESARDGLLRTIKLPSGPPYNPPVISAGTV